MQYMEKKYFGRFIYTNWDISAFPSFMKMEQIIVHYWRLFDDIEGDKIIFNSNAKNIVRCEWEPIENI